MNYALAHETAAAAIWHRDWVLFWCRLGWLYYLNMQERAAGVDVPYLYHLGSPTELAVSPSEFYRIFFADPDAPVLDYECL